jgi:peptidoglycan/LPS O-acetylase OafA/YrhL
MCHYIRNLDALRACAILLVIAFHAQYLAVGWIGVWVFFVISGFLITRSLLELKDVSLAKGLGIFYTRRSLRIWPLYLTYLAAIIILGVLTHKDAAFFQQAKFAIFYAFNLLPLAGLHGEGLLLSHTWSLAVEEQFYLVAAPVVLLLSRNRLTWLFLAIIVLSPAMRQVGFHAVEQSSDAIRAGEFVKLITIFHLDSFLIGALIALYEPALRMLDARTYFKSAAAFGAIIVATFGANYLSLAHDGLIGAGVEEGPVESFRLVASSLGLGVNVRENGGYMWVYTFLALASAFVLVGIMRFGQSFEIPVLNRMGKVSYGMYLFHLPLCSALDLFIRKTGVERCSLTGFVSLVAFVAFVWIAAEISYRWFETPFLSLKAVLRTTGAPVSIMHQLRSAAYEIFTHNGLLPVLQFSSGLFMRRRRQIAVAEHRFGARVV